MANAPLVNDTYQPGQQRMYLELVRKHLLPECTIGELLRDGVHLCYTLEDRVRDGPKVYGETAIAYGTYEIIITQSQRFGVRMPLLCNVPDFEGIRIHPGNKAVDTHGCILVGEAIGEDGISLVRSRLAYNALFNQIQDALDDSKDVWIAIRPAINATDVLDPT